MYIFKKFYLFIFFIFLAASGLSCGSRDLLLQRMGSSLQHAGFSLVEACRFSLSSCGARVPEQVGFVVCAMRALLLRRVSSVVVACGLSCPVACGILVPLPGIEPASPALGRWILNHCATREVPGLFS